MNGSAARSVSICCSTGSIIPGMRWGSYIAGTPADRVRDGGCRPSWHNPPGRSSLDGDALSQVARLIDVGAFGDRGVIGQQLHRYRIEDRGHEGIDGGE